jgi:hypothetical protein
MAGVGHALPRQSFLSSSLLYNLRLCSLLLLFLFVLIFTSFKQGPFFLLVVASNTYTAVPSLVSTTTTPSSILCCAAVAAAGPLSSSSSSALFRPAAFAIHHRRPTTVLMSTELKYKSLEDYNTDRQFQNDNFNNKGQERRTDTNQHTSTTSSISSYNPSLYYDEEWQENNIRRLSAVSNTIFLSAGIMYLTTSSWDINPPTAIEDDSSKAYMIYTLLGNLAPVTYLVNSLFDIHLANCIKKAQKIKRRNKRLLAQSFSTADDNMNGTFNSRHEQYMIPDTWDDNDTSSMDNDTLKTSNNQKNTSNNRTRYSKTSLIRVRKFAAHRREFTAAFTFFIAALFSVLPVILPLTLGLSDDDAFTIFDGISIHTYMLSSIFALMGSIRALGHLDWNLGKADTLETLGDLLFFGGSMVDLILFDFHFDDGVVGWPIFSSTLWCVDALLYLNSDWVASRMLKSKEEIIV